MDLDTDFINRLTCSPIYQIPTHKNEVNDEIFIRVIHLSGIHSSYLDINRCHLLTENAFKYISLCKSLLYLDISYTNIQSIELISSNCLVLKSLNLAGLVIDNYQPLLSMITLELLNLRSSNIISLDDIINCKILRSLDISHTKITNIDVLVDGFTRLEELLLDNCNIEMNSINLSIIHSLNELKALNICDTYLMNIDRWDITLGKDIYIDTFSLREQYLNSIINNQDNELYNILNNGQDINIKFGPWANNQLHQLYNNKCIYRTYKTFFYDYNSNDESILPNALHIAMLLNSVKVIKLLIKYNIDTSCNVWFGSVMNEDKTISIDNNQNENNYNENIYNIKDYINILNISQTHRIINHMIDEDYIGDWQYECNKIQRNYLKIMKFLNNQIIQETLLRVENDIDISFDDLDSPKTIANPSTSRIETKSDNNKHNVNTKIDNIELRKIDSKIDIKVNELITRNLLIKPKIKFPYKRKTKEEIEIQHIIPKQINQFIWRQHPMVNKLIGSSISVTIPDLSIYLNNNIIGKQLINNKIIKYLGYKNYFNSIKRDIINEKNLLDEKKLINEINKWNNLSNKEKQKLKLISLIRYPYQSVHPPYYIPSTPLDDRKDIFLDWLYHHNSNYKDDNSIINDFNEDDDGDVNDFNFDRMSI